MQTGKTLTFGRYEILAELGRGAMGVVYKAYDPKINRVVAIKTISLLADESAEGKTVRDRFLREAEAAGRLSHPRIVSIFDIGESPDSLSPYIVMEHIAGRSLEEILSREDNSLPLGTSLRLVQEVAEGLDYAHLQGIVHRDVKPSNIIIGDDGHARIADFGIAQLNVVDGAPPDDSWGTPGYMSPEQFRGEAVDGRSDLFSLGVILYRMLTGHRPFQGNSALTVARKVQNQEPVPATVFNTELSPELDAVITRAIAKNPAERYQTGMQMVQDLQNVRDGIDGRASQPGKQAEPPADSSYHRVLKTTDASLSGNHAATSNPARVERTPTFFRLDQPWQQVSVGLLTLIALAITFAGLWWVTPNNSSGTYEAQIAFRPALPTASMATIVALEQEVAAESKMKSTRARPTKSSPITADAKNVVAPFKPPSRLCQLGIVVEHHFVTANISVWIDGETSYSHSLRGATKRRVVLFKGVNGYLSDVVPLTAGAHQIRVQVLSADGSYDETRSISASFDQGSEKLLTVGFDAHNRHMRLKFDGEKDPSGVPKS